LVAQLRPLRVVGASVQEEVSGVLEPIYATEIREVGPEVADFLETGLLVLFEVGAPPELAEMSALHEVTHMRPEAPEVGDVLVIEGHEFAITAIGEKAWKNVKDLGHAVFVFNGEDAVEMPGQIYLQQEGSGALADIIRPGARMEIRPGSGTGNPAATEREGGVGEP
jgi:glucitol/sorbitol PTS system EIIA component